MTVTNKPQVAQPKRSKEGTEAVEHFLKPTLVRCGRFGVGSLEMFGLSGLGIPSNKPVVNHRLRVYIACKRFECDTLEIPRVSETK